jgi:3',5'-cyclic AMP phosphodiesterase CpdA
LPENPDGLKLPWYTTLGNHDTEYQGSFNSNLLIPLIIQAGCYDLDDDGIKLLNMSELSSQDESINAYKDSSSEPHWHGFANMPESEFPYSKKEGYYSFDHNAYVHCIILNTCNYTPELGIPKETLAVGVLDQRQFNWMKADIEKNTDKICLIFSHHSPKDDWEDNQSDISAQELMDALCSYENVIAHMTGHKHRNAIRPVTSASGGYWDINTTAVTKFPHEWRRITIKDNGDGKGIIYSRIFPAESIPGWKEGVRTDQDNTTDRNVDLVFAMPPLVAEKIKTNPPAEDNKCFIATAAFGSIMEPEVMVLRKFRDEKLRPYFAGRLFINAYYRMSPGIAKFIASRPTLRAVVRGLLKPLVYIIK